MLEPSSSLYEEWRMRSSRHRPRLDWLLEPRPPVELPPNNRRAEEEDDLGELGGDM